MQYIKLTNVKNNNPSYITGNSFTFEPQTNINKNSVVEVKNHNIHVLFCGWFEYVDIILGFSYWNVQIGCRLPYNLNDI